MSDFVSLYHALSETTSTKEKVDLLSSYFCQVEDSDFGWAVYILRGGKLARPLSSAQLRDTCRAVSGIPLWLIEESYHVVGDLAETIAKLVPPGHAPAPARLHEWVHILGAMKTMPMAERTSTLSRVWRDLSSEQMLVFNKLVTGGLRIGVSRGLVTKALARASSVGEALVAQRLLSFESPQEITLQRLREDGISNVSATPYPFYLAHQLDGDISGLGEPGDWIAEWKWDGIRGQIVKKGGLTAIWSRGEELVSETFPELVQAVEALPDGTVVDGEIVALGENGIASFSRLQHRLNRRATTQKVIAQHPATFIAYDLLEVGAADIRAQSLEARRSRLQEVLRELPPTASSVVLSEEIPFSAWHELKHERETSRSRGVEGVMLKRRRSPYGIGRKKGDWWKWKIDPLSIDGVLLYAQKGHGRRADLFTDFTFAVWDGDVLVPFAKAYSGLTNEELRQVDAFVKSHTAERFGPVRTVEPKLVFEIAFEGLQGSTRHKAGVAVRFPRIRRWRRDKTVDEADNLESLRSLLQAYQSM